MISRKLIVRGFALASALLLGACGTTSQFNGFSSATSEDEKVVRDGGFSETAMAQIAIVQSPDFNGGKISPKALQKIQQYSISCQKQVDAQLATGGQSALNGALPYTIAGLAIGPAAALAFAGAKMTEYATYGSVSYLASGAVNGSVTGSYAMASAKGTCTVEFWRMVVNTDPAFKGTVVLPVFAGKKSGGSVPPALDRSAIRSTK